MSKELETQEEVVVENQNDLLAFNWEEGEDDFFATGEKKTTPPVKEEPKEVEPTEEKPKEEEPKEDFFEESKTKEKETDINVNSSIYLDVLKDLKEQGIFKHVELEEGEDIDAERFAELQQEEYDTEIAARLETWATQELDPDAQAFIKFKVQGGNTEDFFKEYSKSSDIPEGDIENESHQDAVIKYQLKQEGWSNDEIEDRLEYLENSGKKKDFAKRYDAKLKEQIEKNKSKLLEQAEEQKQKAKQVEDNFKASVKDALSEVNEVSGFKISQQDKGKIYDLLTKRNFKLSENQMITGFQKKMGDILQDTEKLILLAKLIDSDFDFTEMKKQIETKKVKEVKSNLQKHQSSKPSGFGSSTQGRSLADLFD